MLTLARACTTSTSASFYLDREMFFFATIPGSVLFVRCCFFELPS